MVPRWRHSLVWMSTYTERLNEVLRNAGFDPEVDVRAAARQLADVLGVSYQAAMKAITGGTKMLAADNNVKAARHYGIDSEWLATGKERPKGERSQFALDVADAFDAKVPDQLKASIATLLIERAEALVEGAKLGETAAAGRSPTAAPRPRLKTPPS